MPFFQSASRIIVTGVDGSTRVDTDDPMFHVVGPRISGSISFPDIGLSEGNVLNQTTTHVLGSCHVACTHAIGAVLFNGSVGGAVGFDRYTTYLGGTLIWVLSAPPKLQNGSWGSTPSDYCAYRFYCAGGQLAMERRIIVLGGPNSNIAGLRAHSITYRMKTGLFT